MGNFLLRAILFAMGVVFAVSLAVAAMLLAAVWGLRLLWAKLTGRPAVSPWSAWSGGRFDPRRGFARYREATRAAQPSAADVANARALGEGSASPVVRGGRASAIDANDVTDVRARPASHDE